MKFLLPEGPIRERKKIHKNLKFENFERKKKKKKKKNSGLEIWRRGSYPQNLAWIHAVVHRFLRNLSLLTTDGLDDRRLRHDTVALLTKSSRTAKVKQS